ncbi:MAG: HAD family hydrolase [Bilophila wadsworthia]
MQLSAFPFSTILFDLDGTLVDSAPDVLEAIAAVLRDAGDPVPRMELSIIGPPLEGIFREVCPDADETKSPGMWPHSVTSILAAPSPKHSLPRHLRVA